MTPAANPDPQPGVSAHAELCFIESGGDNLAATFSPELADLTIHAIDVAAGPRSSTTRTITKWSITLRESSREAGAVRRTSTRSSWPSANSRRICARRPSIRFCGSCVASAASLPISARKNAGTSFVMPAMLEHDRNLLSNQGKTVRCAISAAAMYDLEGEHDVRADQRVDQFV